MVDNEILKSLECCIRQQGCKQMGCPMNEECEFDLHSVEKHAISLIKRLQAEIERLRADVVEVRHGKWVEGAEHFTNGFYEAECSECGNYIRWNEGNSGEWNYCPNCGADMRGGKGDSH